MGRLAGKVGIITGAASLNGIGFACAATMLAEGAQVMITDIEGDALEKSVATLDCASNQRAWMEHDVGSEGDWDRVIADTLSRFGRVDILVNNAGISQMRPMDVVTEPEWQNLIRINLTGPFLGARAAMRQMREQGTGGSIINLSSVAGLVGVEGMPAYTASKGGVRLLTKNIALEGAKEGIRCNSVHPGMILTDILRDPIENAPGTLEAVQAMIPAGRPGSATEVANVVLFLASDESSYVTGTELVVDGGFTAR